MGDGWSWSADEIKETGARVAQILADYLTGLPGRPVQPGVPQPVRDAWANIRFNVSVTARLFGSPVRLSVAARISAMAKFRRFANTGAA